MLESLFNKTPTQILSCEIYEIFKNTFFIRTAAVATSKYNAVHFQAMSDIILNNYFSSFKTALTV